MKRISGLFLAAAFLMMPAPASAGVFNINGFGIIRAVQTADSASAGSILVDLLWNAEPNLELAALIGCGSVLFGLICIFAGKMMMRRTQDSRKKLADAKKDILSRPVYDDSGDLKFL